MLIQSQKLSVVWRFQSTAARIIPRVDVGRALSWVLTQVGMFQVCGSLHCVGIDLLLGFS